MTSKETARYIVEGLYLRFLFGRINADDFHYGIRLILQEPINIEV